MSSDQEILTEQLQILRALYRSYYNRPHECNEPHFGVGSCGLGAGGNMRALDRLAFLLTTEPGDVTAVALDRRGEGELVIAKNRPPTPADDAVVRNIMSAIATDTESVFPLVMTHCFQHINERQSRLQKLLFEFLPTAKKLLDQYSPTGSMEEEVRNWEFYFRVMHPDSTPSVPDIKAIILELFEFCLAHSQLPLIPHDEDTSHKAYISLCRCADALAHSRFLDSLTWYFRDRAIAQMAAKLKRRLIKFYRFYFGIKPLVKRAKKWFPNGEIPYRWANLSTTPDCNTMGSVAVSATFQDALRRLSVEVPRLPHPIFESWSPVVHTCMHAEIRIILDPNLASTLIGCSKKSCFCCTLWIESFNRKFGTQWLTSRSHGKPCTNWTLPGVVYDGDRKEDVSVDKEVLEQVEDKVLTVAHNEIGDILDDEEVFFEIWGYPAT